MEWDMGERVGGGRDNILNWVDRTPHALHLGTSTSGTTLLASLTIRFSQGKKISNIINRNKNYKDNEED